MYVIFQAPEYRKRADRLVGEVKNMFNAVSVLDSSSQNVLRRLEMVDKVERLGIGRHFQTEIAEALDYVHRYLLTKNKIEKLRFDL